MRENICSAFHFIIHRAMYLATGMFLWLARTLKTFCNPIRGPLGSRLLQEDSRLKRNEVISHNYKRYLWAPFLNLGGNGVQALTESVISRSKEQKQPYRSCRHTHLSTPPTTIFAPCSYFFLFYFLQFFAHSHVTHCRVVPVHFSQKLSNFYSIADFFFIFRLWSPPFGGINEFFPFLKAFFFSFFLPLTLCVFFAFPLIAMLRIRTKLPDFRWHKESSAFKEQELFKLSIGYKPRFILAIK